MKTNLLIFDFLLSPSSSTPIKPTINFIITTIKFCFTFSFFRFNHVYVLISQLFFYFFLGSYNCGRVASSFLYWLSSPSWWCSPLSGVQDASFPKHLMEIGADYMFDLWFQGFWSGSSFCRVDHVSMLWGGQDHLYSGFWTFCHRMLQLGGCLWEDNFE